MLVVVQFPFVDIDPASRLQRPEWTLPPRTRDHYWARRAQEHLRAFGARQKRNSWPQGLGTPWPSESFFVSARGIRFTGVADLQARTRPYCESMPFVLRRVFAIGPFGWRVELGAALLGNAARTQTELLSIAEAVCDTTVEIPTLDSASGRPCPRVSTPLLRASPALANALARATRKHAAAGTIIPCSPLVVIDTPLVSAPERSFEGDDVCGRVFEGELMVRPEVSRTPVCVRALMVQLEGARDGSPTSRAYRLAVTRFHYEAQVAVAMLRAISDGRLQVDSAVERHLKNATLALSSERAFGVESAGLIRLLTAYTDVTFISDELVRNAFRTNTRAQVMKLRDRVLGSSQTIIVRSGGRVVNVSGNNSSIISVDSYLLNVNQSIEREQDGQVQEQLKALKGWIDVVNARQDLPAESREQFSKAAGSFAEAVEARDSTRLKVTAEGLKKAAEAVRDIAVPIAATVATIVKLVTVGSI